MFETSGLFIDPAGIEQRVSDVLDFITIRDLDTKMKKALQRSKNFEKKYNEIMSKYGNAKLKRQTKPRGKDVTKSINAIMKDLFKKKDDPEADRIVKTGKSCS